LWSKGQFHTKEFGSHKINVVSLRFHTNDYYMHDYKCSNYNVG